MAVRVLIRRKSDRANLHLYFVDPSTGREVSKSAGTSDRGEAERAAGLWEQELAGYRGPADDGWQFFRDRFRVEHLATLSPKTQACFRTALGAYQRIMEPAALPDVTAAELSVFQSRLLSEDLKIATVASYLSHIRAALNWAEGVGMGKAPRVRIPKQTRRSFMRGRPVTDREYAKILKACPDPALRRLVELLWLSGLRLSEALRLSWDSPPIHASIAAKPYPVILYYAEGHKARRDDVVPMTPDLAAWMRQTPPKARRGLVAPVSLGTMPRVSEAIADVGRAAGVIVNDDGKPASAHDLRRSFGTRWAQQVMPAVLKALMRHADISTTLKFYVGISVTDAGRALWG